MTQSTQSSQWGAGRFFKTLDYFGEIPLLGSVRWLQQLLGRSTSPQPTDVMSQSQSVLLIGQSEISDQLIDQLRTTGQSVAMVTAQDMLAQGAIADISSVASSSVLADAAPDVVIVDLTEQSDLSQLSADVIRQVTERLSDYLRPSLVRVEPSATPGPGSEQALFDFANPDLDVQAVWGALDDVVMGGVSQSGLQQADGMVMFVGNVSTANSGGFASVRTRNFEPPFNLSGWDGIRLRVRGDGNRYKFILRNSPGWDSVAYYASFDTIAHEWMTVDVSFEQFIPTFRARTVEQAPPLNPAQICSLQFMLSKFEHDGGLNPHFSPGEFQLAIAQISAYSVASGSSPQVLFISPESSEIGLRMQQQIQAAMNNACCCTTLQYGSLVAESPSHPITLYLKADAPQPQSAETSKKALSAGDVAKAAIAILQQPNVANRHWVAQRRG